MTGVARITMRATMKSLLKRALLLAFLAVLVAVAWLAYQLKHPPSMAPYAGRWQAPAAPAPDAAGLRSAAHPGELRVTFLGVSTLLFDDGETAVMTDGFFTRPGMRAVFAGKIAPDAVIVSQSLARLGLKRLAAVVVVHSHYDHAMDAPEVARHTGALVVGSESTANVARGGGLPEARIRVVGDGSTLQFGRFKLSFIRSRHAPTPMTGGSIRAPLVPPVRANAYEEGGSFSVLVEHGSRAVLVHGSAGFEPGALQGRHADVVYLGIGTLGMQSEAYRQAYWREVVQQVGARRVIPVHWDDFWQPLSRPLQPAPYPFDRFDVTMAFLAERERADHVEVKLPPVWVAVDPFGGL